MASAVPYTFSACLGRFGGDTIPHPAPFRIWAVTLAHGAGPQGGNSSQLKSNGVPKSEARRERHRRGGRKTPQGPAEQRCFPALRSLCPSPCQGSGIMRPGRSCTQPVLPTANRPMPGPARGAPCARRSPRGACSQLHARRLQSSVRRAGGAVWMPAPNARLCLCGQSRIRCREWRRG